MYFLNGNRIYIKPETGNGSMETQLFNCLSQLPVVNSGKKIFKLNFFVDVDSDAQYQKCQDEIRGKVFEMLSQKIILNFIAQPPLTCKIVIEVFYYDPEWWQTEFISNHKGEAFLFSRDKTRFLIGNVQSNNQLNCRLQSEKAFSALGELFEYSDFQMTSLIRQWNYIENILGDDDGKQNYQEFNDVRSTTYGVFFESAGYPAATGIGMNRGGVIIEFIALDSDIAKTAPVDNPKQIAAHNYSKEVLIGEACNIKTTPKFERARYLELFGNKMIFISGTASIIGEKTVGINNPAEQTKVTIQNILQLYSTERLLHITEKQLMPKYGHARVYVKNRSDFTAIKRMVKSFYGTMPVVYILADICRDDLLVEIEGKVVLE